MCAALLSKYELHPADRLIHHQGKRRETWRRRDMEGTERNVQKMERGRKRRGGRKRKLGGRKDERKESGLGEMSGRERCGERLKDR